MGIAITGFIALGIASMLTMVGSASLNARSERAALMRSHLAQMRLRAYTEPALCVLQSDPDEGVMIWLHDDNPGEKVNFTELRMLWFDPENRTVGVERVKFPDNWTPEMIDAADAVIPKNSDFFSLLGAFRDMGLTVTETLLEEVTAFDLAWSGAVQAAQSVRFDVSLEKDATSDCQTYVVVGIPAHTEPIE